MRGLRLALLLLVVGLAVPVALIVTRALRSVAFEGEVRHEAVAARAFDEMERSLSRILEREEARPFEHYRFYSSGPGQADATQRSPLSELPVDSFVIGYFQIDPDGSVHSPLRPRDLERAKSRGHWPPTPETARNIARIESLLRSSWREAQRRALSRPATGRMDRFADALSPAAARPLIERAERADKSEGSDTAYDLLESLNLGAELRSARRQKVSQEPRSRVYGGEVEQIPAAGPLPGLTSQSRMTALERKNTRAAMAAIEQLPRSDIPLAALEMLEPGTAAGAAESVRVALDPMIGRRLEGDANRFLLYRTVLVGAQGYRQGLLVDRAALGHWLEREVLAPSGLSKLARVRFGGPAVEDENADLGGAGSTIYSHRFGEPFDTMGVVLALNPLPASGSTNTIYALAALLALVAVVGLVAVYRMVAVVVHFAERRNNFGAAVSHELKTPLTAIRMYGEMLRDGLVDSAEKRAEYYGTITDESERLSRLINNVLEFSQLEKGQRELSLRVGPVESVIEEVAEKLRPHAEQQGFRLRIELEDDLPALRFDRDALLQVLFNLVDNAMKYAAAASPKEVVIEARRRGERVAVGVRDYGPGVSKRHLARVFEPFYRAENELTRSTRGTGIGLALVRELAISMGATVSGSNASGGGFRVQLAFLPAEA